MRIYVTSFCVSDRGNWLREYLRFYIVYGLAMVMSMGLVALGVQVFTLHPVVAQALATGVTIVASFFGHKNISFAVPRSPISNRENTTADVKRSCIRKDQMGDWQCVVGL